MGTMTMTQRPPTSGMGSGVSLPPLMEVLGDLWRAPHSDQSRYNMPRKFAERESPILGRRTPLAAISSIASVLEPFSSPPSSKRRKVNSPPRRPLPLTRLSLNRAVSDSQDKESNQTTVEYTGYTPVYPPGDIDRRRLSNISSTSQPEVPFLPPVSSITSPRGSSSESERHNMHPLPSLLSHTQPPTPSTSGSRYPYDADYPPHPYNSTAYYRHSGEHSSYLPPSPPSHTQHSSHTSPHPAPLLTQAYPNPRGGMYMPRPYQPISMHDRSPLSPSIHGGLETFDQVPRLGTKRRRGNLPKHVTDTLRNWLTNHVAHPYPTEEEKQQLCQITGLNMNQISNWFINARRRKLPQQRSDAEQHLLAQPRPTTPPRPSPSLGHTRSHSRDTTSILPPPLLAPGPYSSSGR
ncbi:hypothetical protein EV426DRAFT_574415 [Tirmania nivea]|nr:hypothetical protein EV426DRAFT_574415 [Tirmania nivea]